MKKFKNFNVGVKQSVLIILMAVIGITSGYLLTRIYTKQVYNSQLMAVTERQALLIQLIATNSHIPVSENTLTEKAAQENIFLFQSALASLKNGGKVAGTNYLLPLSVNKDQRAKKLTDNIDKLWNRYKQALQKANSVQSDEQKADLLEILDSIEEHTLQLNAYYKQTHTAYNKWVNAAAWLLCISVLTAIFIIYLLFGKYVKKPIERIAEFSSQAALGDLSQTVAYDADDELGEIARSINIVTQNQLQLSEFAEKIGEGDFNTQYTQLGEGDKLGQSLVTMREKLLKISAEDRKRIWATEGMAKFGELLRSNNDNIQHLAEKIIIDLIKYLQANQGAIFITQEEQGTVYLELIAAYAWNRKKNLQKTVEPGEGLVGQVYRDKDTVYLTDVPQNFVTITSGLGKANPTCMLLVPLKVNDEVHGVIELASLKEFAPFEIEYVEKLSESIASTLSTVKTNERTKRLLDDARMLNDQMRQQEEEMRQNLEELSSTQEEMQRKEVELTGLFTSINHTLATAEFDLDAKFITANTIFCQLLDYSLEEIKDKPHHLLIKKSSFHKEQEDEFWQDLKRGMSKSLDIKVQTKRGGEIWLNASYTPVFTKNGIPYKVIQLAQDITSKKQTELANRMHAEELQAQGEILKAYTEELEVLKGSLSEKLEEARAEMKQQIRNLETEKAKNIAILEGCVDGVIGFNEAGIIDFFNQAAEEIWAISRSEFLGKNITLLMPISIAVEVDGSKQVLFIKDGNTKQICTRTEVTTGSAGGEDISLLITLSKAKVGEEYTYTLFVQKISVELF